MTSSDEQRVRVRKRYILHACIECQRRKRKCTGGTLCRNCQHSGSECIYTPFNRTKKPKTPFLPTPNSSSGNWQTADLGSQSGPEGSHSQRSPNKIGDTELVSRGLTLEQDYEALKRELTWMKDQERERTAVRQLSSPAEPSAEVSPFSPPNTSTVGSSPSNVFERNIRIASSTSFYHQIDLLNRSVARDLGKGEEPLLVIPEEPGSDAMGYESLSAGLRRELDQIVDQTRSEDIEQVMQSMDIYFGNIQPHYPCVNEAHFRAQFAAFLANDTKCMSNSVSIQFAALLNFMIAVARIMYDNCTSDDNPPGCKEFYRADKLLSHANWLEKANIMTIQILLNKSSYYLYISRLNAAYDTMGTAVRLCFQLGLHNEPSWGADCSFYDRTYRQRMFWSIYCLNHMVAQNSGVPDLIREEDFDVGHPKCVDDRMLYPNCPPLPEMHKASLVTYLLEIIKWAKLSSDIWDAMFGVRVKRPISQEFIADTDAKIQELSRQTPSSLLWPSSHNSETTPAFIVQQSFILYLRMRALRMLLRREEMVSLRYEKRTAQLCIDIATDMITAVELSYTSSGLRRPERYAYTLHLTGALVPIICIIVRRSNGEDLIRPSISLFNRALRIMEAMSDGLLFARRTLHQLRRPIQVAQKIIESDWTQASTAQSSNVQTTQNVVSTPTSVMQNHMWGTEGAIPIDSMRGEQVAEDWQRTSDRELVWEDLDLWNNFIMSNWQS